jgi:hypothetical protein
MPTFRVAVLLYFLKKILAQSLTAVVGVALVFSFTGFFVYEQRPSLLVNNAMVIHHFSIKH